MLFATSTSVGVIWAMGDEALRQGTAWFVLALIGTLLLMRLAPSRDDVRGRLRVATLLVGLHVLLLPVTGVLRALSIDSARDLRLLGTVVGTLAIVGLGGLLIFSLLAPRLQLHVPRILQDLLVAAVGTLALFGVASRGGVNLSGIVATGAVLTGVIGLALQDTLGNVLGGLSLQIDSTIRVGDWIRVQDVAGRVVDIGWRSTAIETRNWETVVLPNSLLTRSLVTVLGRRAGEAPRWRRWVQFNVDFRALPTRVTDVVIEALRANPIDNVAVLPAPDCVLIDLGDSSARYAVRYFLVDFARDDPTDALVRTRIYYALSRAGIPLAMPSHAVFLSEDSVARKAAEQSADLERRVVALGSVGLFHDLDAKERGELAVLLRRAPFAPGEILTQQGAEAHHLYLIHGGRVSVRIQEAGVEREVAQLGAGEFFGEMSLLTGERRAATVVALSEVECYRLDAAAFKHLLERRPDLADKVATELAERRVELLATREQISDRKSLVEQDHHDLLRRIRLFFGL
jgi:small-conductance mechanosensitive channel